jgi:hypothetical protein
MTDLNETDLSYVRRAIALACAAVAEGNRPFAAVLVAADDAVLAESCDTSNMTGDPLGHGEINVLRASHVKYGLARVIYGLSDAVARPYIAKVPRGLSFPSGPIFALAAPALQVFPGVLLDEAKRPFELYAAKGES